LPQIDFSENNREGAPSSMGRGLRSWFHSKKKTLECDGNKVVNKIASSPTSKQKENIKFWNG
jgi:hypothetical protein